MRVCLAGASILLGFTALALTIALWATRKGAQ